MDPESKKLLEETFALEQENNKMLHKIRNVQKWSTFWTIFKFVVIFGLAFGSFYFLEPYLNKIVGVYNSIPGAQQNSSSSNSLPDLLKKLF